MPSGPVLHKANEFETVIFEKSTPIGRVAKTEAVVNAARQTGAHVQTTNKFDQSKSQKNRKLDEVDQAYKHQTVGVQFKKALMQARTAKQMSQSQLATVVNEKATIINEYEAGKAQN